MSSNALKENMQSSGTIDVFTHSSTDFPGAWSEEDVDLLLDCWQRLVDEVKNPKKRSNVPFRLMKFMKRKKRDGFQDLKRNAVRREMLTLLSEYMTFCGLEKAGVSTVKKPCLYKLQNIMGVPNIDIPIQTTHNMQTNVLKQNPSVDENVKSEQIVSKKEKPAEEDNQSPEIENLDKQVLKKKRRKEKSASRKLVQQQENSDLQMLQNETDSAVIQLLLSKTVKLQRALAENQTMIMEALQKLKLVKIDSQ